MGIQSDLLSVANEIGFYAERCSNEGSKVILSKQNHLDYNELFAQYDIVHFQRAFPKILNKVGRRRNYSVVYTHRSGKHKYPVKRLIMYKAFGLLLRLKKVEALTGNTNHACKVASKLLHFPYSRFSTTYNGILPDLLIPERDQEDFLLEMGIKSKSGRIIIGTSANLRKWKRIDILIRAFKELPENAILLVIGDGKEKKNLEKLAENCSVSSNIKFVGKTNQIANYLQLIDIFVLPSNNGESFGNSAVEALCCGIPTLVFRDGGGLTEHVIDSKNGFLVRNKKDLIQKLNMLIEDSETRVSLGKTASGIKEKYSLENMFNGYNNVYKLLIKRH
jgi:glycosyltransferase involved in cell wall biosynthesis